MRTKPKTIKLAKIRRLIREAIDWHRIDDGMPESWTTDNYQRTKKCKPGKQQHFKHDCFYYIRSDRAIEVIAKKIYEVARK